MTAVARAISWIFLPLFMPLYALLLVMYVPSNQDYIFNYDCLYTLAPAQKWGLIYMFGVFCTIAPGASYIALYRTKIISTIEMDDRRERSIPIAIMLFYCLALYGVFMVKLGPGLVSKFVLDLPLAGAVVTTSFLIINRWTKISIHAGAAGIVTGFILAYILQHAEYQLWMLALALFVSGLIMSARMYLGKHTMTEVLAGWFTGTLITFAINYYY